MTQERWTILTPFLAHVVDPASITHDEAQRARDACLKSLKERLVERANIMMARLTEENSKLSKKQAAYQRNARDRDAVAEEEFERFCAEAMFRIQILARGDGRLDLDAKLAADEESARPGVKKSRPEARCLRRYAPRRKTGRRRP